MISNLRYLTHFGKIGICLFLVTKCSLLSGKREVIKDEQMVPKSQYDRLLEKYQQEIGKKYTDNSEDLIDYSIEENSKENGKAKKDKNLGLSKKHGAEIGLEKAVSYLERSVSLMTKGDYGNSMEILQGLENNPSKQIKVRAKYYIGEVLFAQDEYDMALQVYEELIHNYAFSGLVLNSLERLVTCSEKLGLEDKKKRYYSILHDFF